ncbi:MAG: hypothetical protein KKD05_11045 [Candidatus Omnitrophica bacterium]|nr:hypothetical protein [Candidatus Omnitrophota bacterium]
MKSDKLIFLLCLISLLLYHSSGLGRGGTLRALGVSVILGFLLVTLKYKKITQYIYICCSWWFYPILIGIFFLHSFFNFLLDVLSTPASEKNKKGKNIVIYLVFVLVLFANFVPLVLTNSHSPFFKDQRTEKFSYDEVKSLPEFGIKGRADPTNRLKKNLGYLLSLDFVYEQILNIETFSKDRKDVWPINFLIVLLICIILKNISFKNFGKINKQKTALILIFYIEILMGILTLIKITDCYGSLIWGLFCISSIFIVFFGKGVLRIHRTLIVTFFSSALMFIILFCVPYKISAGMHFPARQIGLYLPWFLAIFVLYNYENLIKKNNRVLFEKINVIVLVMLVFGYLGCYKRDLMHAKDENLYSFAQTLPKTVIFAGHPKQMDFIPFFGKREVLACYEIAPLWGKGIWLKYKQRTFDVFNALYSRNEDEFKEFCRKYEKLDIYFVVDKSYFSQGYLKGEPYFYPFTPLFKEYAKRSRFFLLGLDKKKILFELGDVFVIRCRDF